MINLIDIANRISNPDLINRTDIESLQQLCDTYPYSQVFPILYLKSLANTNDIRLDQELEKYAYRICDRRTLYYLIQGQREIQEIQNSTIEALNDAEETTKSTDNQTAGANNEAFEVRIQELQSSRIEKLNEIQDDVKSLNNDAVESLNNKEPESISAYSLESEEKRLSEEKQRLIEALKADPRLNDPIEESSFVKSVDIDSKKSFSNWLQANQSYNKVDEVKPTADELINKFIETAPKISSPKDKLFEDRTERTNFFSPTKKAKESLDEGQLPVSETLAKIFAAQGNFPKAIYAYEQLMLIIPEKKIFFANQISELQKKINLK